jgi:alkylation response protein AidB-like acyl-CoA dehydrogenase
VNATGRAAEEARIEAAEAQAPYRWYPQRGGRPDLLVQLASEGGRISDPIVRQEIARVHALVRCGQWMTDRHRALRAAGRAKGVEGSLSKLHATKVARAAAHTHSLIAGPSAMVVGESAPRSGVVAEIVTSVPAVSIAGGTDEIQRNIVAERMLGLPRDAPF